MCGDFERRKLPSQDWDEDIKKGKAGQRLTLMSTAGISNGSFEFKRFVVWFIEGKMTKRVIRRDLLRHHRCHDSQTA